MIIAVTGSMGFVGRHLCARLRGENEVVREFDILNGHDWRDWNTCRAVPEFDVLVHLAARIYVPDSYAEPREFMHTNIVSVLNSLELCRLRAKRMIFASSYVYGQPAYMPIDEDHPLDGFNPYAESKIIGERLCESYHREFGVPVIVLRPFNVYGPGQNGRFLIPSMIGQARSGRIVLRDPRPRRDFLYVTDMAAAYVQAVRLSGSGFEIINIGYGQSFSIQDIVDLLKRHFVFDVEFLNEYRKNEIMDTCANIEKARRLLSWEPRIDLGTGIEKMI